MGGFSLPRASWEASWAALGEVLGGLGDILMESRAILELFWSDLWQPWRNLERSWAVLGRSWARLGGRLVPIKVFYVSHVKPTSNRDGGGSAETTLRIL